MNWSDPIVKSDCFSIKLYEKLLEKALEFKYIFLLVKETKIKYLNNL